MLKRVWDRSVKQPPSVPLAVIKGTLKGTLMIIGLLVGGTLLLPLIVLACLAKAGGNERILKWMLDHSTWPFKRTGD